MLFSIVIPIYKVLPYVERCMKSLKKQKYKNFEVIFVDDCGNDGSMDLVKKYASCNYGVKIVYNQNNLGTYHARRRGVERAIGDYIIFLDPDDELSEDFLKKLASHIEYYKTDMVFYDIKYVPKRKFYQAKSFTVPFNKSDRVISSIYRERGNRIVWAGTAGRAYKKNILNRAYEKLDIDESFRYIYTEDKLVYYTVLLQNPTYSTLNHKGYVYYTNESSITNKDNNTNDQYLVEQFLYTNRKLKEIVNCSQVNKIERAFFDYLLNKSDVSQISLMMRYEESGKNYLSHVWRAFILVPNIRQLLRIFIYLFSLRKIKL